MTLYKISTLISAAVGKISKPYLDRQDVDTKAYEIRKLAEAKADEIRLIGGALKENQLTTGDIKYQEGILAISSGETIPLPDHSSKLEFVLQAQERASDRLTYKEMRRQLNIETVTSKVAEELKDSDFVTDEKLDEDWITRFFNIIEDISNEEMQSLWAKILAGEIKKPKSYSIRSLELLRNISTEEAEIFSRLAQLRIKMGSDTFVHNGDNGQYLKSSQNIGFKELLLLTELGLLSSADNMEFSLLPIESSESTVVVEYGKMGAFIFRSENVPKQAIRVLIFTKTGIELANLVDQTPDPEYLHSLCSSFIHPNVKILLGTLVHLPNDQFQLLDSKELA